MFYHDSMMPTVAWALFKQLKQFWEGDSRFHADLYSVKMLNFGDQRADGSQHMGTFWDAERESLSNSVSQVFNEVDFHGVDAHSGELTNARRDGIDI